MQNRPTAEILAHPHSTRCNKPSSLLAAQRAAAPMDRTAAIGELTRCLTLCAPSGMTTAERGLWLAAAWAEVADIPEAAFLDATAKARKLVDHPAKLVPAIIRESQDFADILHKRLRREEAQWANRNAPRLKDQKTPEPWEQDREEVAEMMAKLTRKLKASA